MLLQSDDAEDDRIAERVMQTVRAALSPSAGIGVVVRAVGERFLGAPYRAQTLETAGAERLVVNLRGFDCVTFVESTLALARCIVQRRTTAGDFRAELTRIRYRGGVLDGYESRLHYFSDWIHDNGRKGIVRDMTRELGGIRMNPAVNFMTSHAQLYPRLSDRTVRSQLRKQEIAIGARARRIIPVAGMTSEMPGIEDGDIVAIATSTPGLDVVHTGLAARIGANLHFLHAPLSGGVVIISEQPLAGMIRSRHSQTGIMVARPLSPG
jgi:hypothetical protein